MILKGFKENSKSKYLNKLLSKRQVNVTNTKVSSIGVILNVDEFDDLDTFRDLADAIKVHHNRLKVVVYSESKKDALLSWVECFNPKDFGWNGAINNLGLQTFVDESFDLLLSYYQEDLLELKLITASSKSKFKVGVLQTDERLNDLIIKTNVKEFDVFSKELAKYLTILNKI